MTIKWLKLLKTNEEERKRIMDDLIGAFVDMSRAAEKAEEAIRSIDDVSNPELLDDLRGVVRLISSIADHLQGFFVDLRNDDNATVNLCPILRRHGLKAITDEAKD